MSYRASRSGQLRELTWGWWLALLIGAASVVAGVIVLSKPSDSLATLAVVSGIFILVDGIVELVAALIGGQQNSGSLAVLGVLSAIVGVLLIRHPLGGVRAVALLLGLWLIAAGVVRFVSAFVTKPRAGRIVVGLVLAGFGIVIVSEPHIGYATLALIAGLSMITYGVTMTGVGWMMHVARHEEVPPVADAGVTA